MEWIKKEREVISFQLEDEPEFIHIIKTGFNDRYFVVYEDAYEICNQMKVESYSKQEIFKKFNINLDL